jgi:pimeloyl-ACP methyl ester carboxylesterase
MPNLYALLTAVNHYDPQSANVSSLSGCRNDILRMQAFLEDRFPKERRNIATLIDADASYRNVVSHFGDEFLLRAGKGDIVLFAYSGHGSREGAAPEFKKYYPDGKDETLVLHDSRTPGGLDLADKELALLVERVAQTGAHVALLLDCCHAGSATRTVEDIALGAARQTSDRQGARPLDSYLCGAYAKMGSNLYLPNSRHISLAACDRTEKAWELTNKHGLFSHALMQILEETGGQISYADLFARVRIAISKITGRQRPQFEPYGLFNAYEGFLGLGGASEGKTLRVFFQNHKWQASLGAVHGLPTASGRAAEFEVLKNGEPLGRVRSSTVGLESSTLAPPDFDADTTQTYEARLCSLPEPKTVFGLTGSATRIEAAMQALEDFRSVYFELSDDAPQAAYRLEIGEDKILLFRSSDNLRLRTIEGNDWPKMHADAFEKLEHFARWEKMLALDNAGARINRQDIELILTELDDEGNILRKTKDSEVIVDILQQSGEERKVPFRLEARNNNPYKTRHCALFYASADYGFFHLGFNEPVPPASTVLMLDKKPDGQAFSFELNGQNEEMDIFKLFVSNSKISGEALQQNAVRLGETADYWTTRGGLKGERDLAGERGVNGFSFGRTEEDVNDWFALTLKVKCVAQEASVGAREVSLAQNFIKIHAHPAFRAELGTGSVSAGSRNIEPLSVITELARITGADLISFGPPTRGASQVNMLELTGIQNEASLVENPLQLDIAANLGDETLLPLTFDGEHILPIGEVERLDNGDARVRISNLPDTTEPRKRSLGKALKLVFVKLVLRKDNVRFLRWVDYSGEKSERRTEGLKEKVKSANNILVLLHGIIGDTKEMAESMRKAYDAGLTDLVLTFDYENLNTPIEETARHFANMLEEAGITPNGKKITLLAHSMGGLVSRHFIENLNGARVVRRLVLAGTPNAGSEIARVMTYRDYAIPLLTLMVNLPWGIPFAGVMMGILQKSKGLTLTLEQMDPRKSEFLKNLNMAADPGIPYYILAGRLHEYLAANADRRGLMDKAFKLGGKLFYGEEPNDIAVSVESIGGVPGGRRLAPVVVEKPAHHLNYFEDEESMEVLMRFLGE